MTWNDITLRKWNQIDSIYKKEYSDDIEQTADIISVLFDIENPMDLTPQEFSKYVEQLSFLSKPIPEKKLCNSYTINGTLYNFKGNIYEISMGALMDWRKYSTEENINYAQCLSVFLIPDGHKYDDGYDMDKTIADIESLPIADVLKLFNFFRAALQLSMDILLNYFNKLLKKTKLTKEQKETIKSKIKEAQEILDLTSFHTPSAIAK